MGSENGALRCGEIFCKQRPLIGRWVTAEEAEDAKTISSDSRRLPAVGSSTNPTIVVTRPLLLSFSSNPHFRYQVVLSSLIIPFLVL